MKIGVSAFAWTTRVTNTHTRLLPALREHGLDGFEIPMFDPSDLDAREWRRAFEANDLACTVCAILPSAINPISPDASIRARSFGHLVQCIETAVEAGATLIGGPLFAPIGYLPGRRRTRDEWNWAIECFQALGTTLDASNITLSIEPVNRSETFFLNTVADAKTFCEAINHPRVGITMDTFHANIEEKSLPSAIDLAGKHLKHVHVSENDRGLLGSGHTDLHGIVATLKQIEYDEFLMIEGFGYSADEPASLGVLWADVNVSPEDIAFQGADYLRGLLV